MRRTTRRLLLVAVLLAAGAAVIALIATYGGDWFPRKAAAPPANGVPARTVHVDPTTKSVADAAAARSALDQFDEGQRLLAADKPIEARTALSAALLTDQLPADKADQARAALEKLAERTILSDSTFDGDVYTDRYRIKRGDSLQRIELASRLHVPSELLERINHISDPGKLMEGQTIKLIYGPFHAVVYKGQFVMDIYLQPEGKPRLFIKRLPVGLGKNGSTPVGAWHVRLGRPAISATQGAEYQPSVAGKLTKARFDPPPNCEIDHSINYGEPGYPFGEKGMFIPLEGDDENTSRMTNYGIHSTNDPASIGKEGSLGCIRLRDNDIDLVFSLLYEKWSTVETRP
ncbi:MAG: L,D-transpeptidase family protein [Phycisphaerae bacterium]